MQITSHFDIIVVGGGFSGCAAALAAARKGKQVLLLEEGGSLGGAAAQNLVLPFMDWVTSIEKDGKHIPLRLSDGIFTEITKRLEEMNAFHSHEFHEEYLKVLLDRMMKEANIAVLFHAKVCAVSKQIGHISHITCAHMSGLQDFSADYFIDCTGDADIVAFAELPFHLGREKDSLCQPMTLCFRMTNVDTSKINRKEIDENYKKAQINGRIKNPREDVLMFRTLIPGVIHFNSTRIIKRNPTDPFDVSIAEAESREQMLELVNYLTTEVEAFKNAKLLTSATHIGIRESRMLDGVYCLTADDLKNCTRFPDAIAAGNYDIDIHNPEGTGTSHYYFKAGEYYTIPYRTLISPKADNLLVAGRCISATHEAQASIRIMPTVCTLGEAAGVAAAIAHTSGETVQNVDIAQVQAVLKSDGAFIGI